MTTLDNSYFIKPEFLNQQSQQGQPQQGQPQQGQPQQGQGQPQQIAPVITTSFVDSIKEHKMLIITLALVIIILICIIVWLTVKGDKSIKKGSKLSPEKTAKVLPPDIPATPTFTPTQVPEPIAPVQPSVQPNKPNPPVAQEMSKPTTHDDIVTTSDDDELMEYMNTESIEEDEEVLEDD